MSGRRVYDSPMADSRRALFTAALELLQERGPSAVRVRDIAVAADTSTMGVYTHFGSKQGLVEELYGHGFRSLTEELQAVATSPDSRRHLLALTLAYRAFALENAALYGLMFERAIPEFIPSNASRLESLVSFQLFVEQVRAWHGSAGDPDGDAYLIWCTAHGLVSIELTHRRWGGPVMEHLAADGESTFASAIGKLLDALDQPKEAASG
jgi:AcrR family transcriptional regulator